MQKSIVNFFFSTARGAENNYSFLGVLPEDMVAEIFQHLSITQVIFSVGNVCRLWREISFPVILKRYQAFAQLVNDSNIPVDYLDLFHTRNGRNFIRLVFKEHVYGLATRLVKYINVQENVKLQLIDFSSKKLDWFEKELKLLESYSQYFENLISNSYSKKVTTTSTASNNSKMIDEKKQIESKTSSSGLSSVFTYFSSLFNKNVTTPSSSAPLGNKNSKQDKFHGFKVIMLGEHGVGKTSLINSSIRNMKLNTGIDPYSSPSFLTQRIKFIPHTVIGLEMWDLTGAERYRQVVPPMYYRGAQVALAMFDLSDSSKTFKTLERYLNDLDKHNPMEVIVIGNKTDLVPSHFERADSRKQAQTLAFDKLEGALYVEITNTEPSHSRILLVYSALIIHLNKKNQEQI